MSAYEFYWEQTSNGGVRLCRVMGMSPEVVLPEQIEGYPLTEIGAYCFAERKIALPADVKKSVWISEDEMGQAADAAAGLRELSGSYVEKIILPDSVKKIGMLAFYHCVKLQEVSLGSSLCELGSDVFMNCRRLKHILMRCGVGEKSGFRLIAAQISSDITVSFLGSAGNAEEPEAVLLFPEYYESYDEVAPAHLFGRNIEGEGFRARQAFKGGVIDLAQYDAIFPKACAEETEETLCAFAMNRLRYPAGLGAAPRKAYETYVLEHAKAICKKAIGERRKDTVTFLCEHGYASRTVLEVCISWAVEQEWAEGAAFFMRLKEQYFKEKKQDKYAFEE